MKTSIHTEQALRQTQTLTPQQVAYIRLLEMNDAMFEQEVATKLEEFPALGIDENEIAPSQAEEETDDEIPHGYYPSQEIRRRSGSEKNTDFIFTNAHTQETTLQDHLKEQYALTPFSIEHPELNPVADFVIDSLDSNGYLFRSVDAMADDMAILYPTSFPAKAFEEVISVIQGLDPAGVAASNLQQCLILQAERLDNDDIRSTVLKILKNGFDLLVDHRYDDLASKVKVDKETLAKALKTIRSFNPKPGASFAHGGNALSGTVDETISPDFVISVDEYNRIVVTMPSHIPNLVIEEKFTEAYKDTKSREAISWINRQRQDASSFIEVVKMRRNTLMDVMLAITSFQRDFFIGPNAGEISALRPMILEDIATMTQYDISTISRAVKDKYVQTQWEILPLKFFFSEGVGGNNQENAVAQSVVIDAMKKIIEGENPQKPLSDEAISNILKQQGYNVARRTVAKYRDLEGILPARLRRQL